MQTIFLGKNAFVVLESEEAWNGPQMRFLRFCRKLNHGMFLIFYMKLQNRCLKLPQTIALFFGKNILRFSGRNYDS